MAIGPASTEGDDVFVMDDTMLHGAPHDRALHMNELGPYTGSLRDVLDPAQKNLSAPMIFNDPSTQPPWLDISDRPIFRGVIGREILTLADMPALWKAEMTRRLPQIARDPVWLLRG